MTATASAHTVLDFVHPSSSPLKLVPPGVDGPSALRQIRVLLADAQTLVRAGFRALFQAETGMAITAEATTGEQAVELAQRTWPDVVLIDADLPGLDAVEATRQIALLPRTRVVVLTPSVGDDRAFALLRAGASGILVKDSDTAELMAAVRVVARGDAALSPSLTRRLIARMAREPEVGRTDSDALDELTAREREVMALAGRALTNEEIAERLDVSPATAKTHVNRVMMKLRAHNRAQLVACAYETGLVLSPSR